MFHKNGFWAPIILMSAFFLFLPLTARAEPMYHPDGPQDRQVRPVYWQPDANSAIIGNLEDRTALVVTGKRGDFYQISLGEFVGYLAKNDVVVDDNLCYYVNCQGDDPVALPCVDLRQLEDTRRNILRIAHAHLGTPYVWGGKTPGGFDCSGFVQYVFSQAGFHLNRTATAQLENTLIVEADDLLAGDLVFFENTDNQPGIVSHVGIYVGAGVFIHAAGRGITYSSLEEDYYKTHFLWGRRVLLPGMYPYRSLFIQSF